MSNIEQRLEHRLDEVIHRLGLFEARFDLAYIDVRRKARWLTIAFLVALPAALFAQQFVTTGRDTLRGLDGIEVIVEALPPELVEAGLTTETVRTDIVDRLEAARITVYGTQDENPSPAKPYLYLLVQALALPGDAGHAASIHLDVRQTLQSPVTGSRVVNALTWDAHTLLAVPSGQLGLLRDEIQAHVDVFIRDWQAVHPRHAALPAGAPDDP
jgi:hypothetical protein